jgi:hypothetical protein
MTEGAPVMVPNTWLVAGPEKLSGGSIGEPCSEAARATTFMGIPPRVAATLDDRGATASAGPMIAR